MGLPLPPLPPLTAQPMPYSQAPAARAGNLSFTLLPTVGGVCVAGGRALLW